MSNLKKATLNFKRAVQDATDAELEETTTICSQLAHMRINEGTHKKRWLDIARLLRRETRRRTK